MSESTELKITTESPEAASILMEILMEVERAEIKHPVWPSCHVKQIAFISEESGELTREGNLLDEGIGSFAKIRTEAIQTAATVIRFLKKFKETERAYDQQGIIEYFVEGSDEPYFMLERDDHE